MQFQVSWVGSAVEELNSAVSVCILYSYLKRMQKWPEWTWIKLYAAASIISVSTNDIITRSFSCSPWQDAQCGASLGGVNIFKFECSSLGAKLHRPTYQNVCEKGINPMEKEYVGRQVKTFTYLPNTWNMDRGGNNMNRAEQIHITYMYIYVHYIYVHCTYM